MIDDFARKFVEAGIAIIPLRFKDKRPDARFLPKDKSGQPSWDIYKTQLPSSQEIGAWLRYQINYGVVLGWNNLAVLDFDDTAAYGQWMLWTARQSGFAEYVARNAFRVSSARGVHVYFRLAHPEKKNRKLPGIDFKSSGYVVGPGSTHPTGLEYRANRSDFVFPLLQNLSDILPVSLLAIDIPSKSPATAAQAPAAASPWQVVNRAGKYSGSLVSKIKKQLRIEDYFPDAVPTSMDGRWLIARCPLHDDHSPSMWIDTKEQICGCFSGCTNKPLDVINLYSRVHGIDLVNTIYLLAGGL